MAQPRKVESLSITVCAYSFNCKHDGAQIALGVAPLRSTRTGHVKPKANIRVPTDNGFCSVEPRDPREALALAKEFTASLNLTEKAGIITGSSGSCIGNIQSIPRLNFTGICMLDGPQGINRADLVSVFPSGILVGATWDVDHMYARGKAMAAEFRGKGSHVQLGPVAGALGRHALGGRNWEGFSADPYLAGKGMDATVRGIQDMGVQACSKHYIGNEQETQRSNSFLADGTEVHGISSNIDDRTLHELYLWPFADAIRAGTASLMCSYNRVNQTYACENPHLLNDILRKELGFEGYVVSDWFATHSGHESIQAGLDVNMPGAYDQASIRGNGASYWGAKNITRMVAEGLVEETRIDEMVQRLMLPYYYLRQDADFPTTDPTLALTMGVQHGIDLAQIPFPKDIPSRDVRADHAKLIRKIGADGIVLLKNVNNTLPLKTPRDIGVFGNDASPPTNGIVFHSADPFEIGTLDIGGGSGTARHTYLVSPWEAIMAKAKETDSRVQYIFNNSVIAANQFQSIYPIPQVCLVFINTFASEGWDRTDFESDWNSTLVVENVARKCSNTVVVTHSAGVNTLPWANHPNVTAILAAHLPGQESGNSIVDVLWGKVNPSGRLPYTIPAREEDYNIPIVNLTESEVTSPGAWQANFTEGQFIDYRHFDKHDIKPLYEFGFGLSYTSFELQDTIDVVRRTRSVTTRPDPQGEILPGGNADLWKPILTLKTGLTNTGSVTGAAVPQLYMSFPDGAPEGTPVQVLRGFEKFNMRAGESRVVSFELLRRDVSYWDVPSQTWIIPSGEFTFRVGFSSRDVQATVKTAVLS
ncbi:putative beta-glucosidase G [Paramyrothecium foliicola]|nr:putative beta-glucosidase G [Paramyrothecium foliicola]